MNKITLDQMDMLVKQAIHLIVFNSFFLTFLSFENMTGIMQKARQTVLEP